MATRIAFLRRQSRLAKEMVAELLGDDLDERQHGHVLDALQELEAFEDTLMKSVHRPEQPPQQKQQPPTEAEKLIERIKNR